MRAVQLERLHPRHLPCVGAVRIGLGFPVYGP